MQHNRINRHRFTALRMIVFARQSWAKVRYPAVRQNRQQRTQFYSKLWRAAAEKIGAGFTELDRDFFEIQLNGRSTRMYKGLVMLDDPVTLHVAGNKPLVHKLLVDAGLRVPAHREFTSDSMKDAEDFLRDRKGPCVVKPARDTGGGDGVTTNVASEKDLYRASAAASLFGKNLLIEQQVAGESYRLLYLHGRLLHAIHRQLPGIIGDGKSTLRQLIVAENKLRRGSKSVTLTALNFDHDMWATLRNAGLRFNSVPEAGRSIIVKTVVNDNSKSENADVTSQIAEPLRVEGAIAVSALGIELASVDIITTDLRMSLKESGGAIIDVNTTPGLHHHYNIQNPECVDVATPILKYLLGVEK